MKAYNYYIAYNPRNKQEVFGFGASRTEAIANAGTTPHTNLVTRRATKSVIDYTQKVGKGKNVPYYVKNRIARLPLALA